MDIAFALQTIVVPSLFESDQRRSDDLDIIIFFRKLQHLVIKPKPSNHASYIISKERGKLSIKMDQDHVKDIKPYYQVR